LGYQGLHAGNWEIVKKAGAGVLRKETVIQSPSFPFLVFSPGMRFETSNRGGRMLSQSVFRRLVKNGYNKSMCHVWGNSTLLPGWSTPEPWWKIMIQFFFQCMSSGSFSVDDKPKHAGTRQGLFTEKLDFLLPESMDAIPTYRVMSRSGDIIDPSQDPKVLYFSSPDCPCLLSFNPRLEQTTSSAPVFSKTKVWLVKYLKKSCLF
jgi:hypothetical protein